MPKVKLLVSRAGPDGVENAGDEIDVGTDEAKRMVEAEQAELVRSAAKETATRKVNPEKATK